DVADIALPLPHGIVPQHAHRAGVRGQEGRQQFDGGAFASAVWPRIGDDFAALNGQVNILQSPYFTPRGPPHLAPDVGQAAGALTLAEGFRDTLQVNHGVPCRGSGLSRYVHSGAVLVGTWG